MVRLSFHGGFFPSSRCSSLDEFHLLRKGELLLLKYHQGQRYSRDGPTHARAATVDRIDVRTPTYHPDPLPGPETTPGSCPRVGAWGAPHRPWVGPRAG